MTRVPVNPDLLRWARERAGMTQADLAPKFKKLSEWESGETQPTFRQLEAFARTVRVPFGYLFLPEPPEERLPIADFRTVTDKASAGPSPDLLGTLYAMQRRQAWLREHLVENDAEPLSFAGSARLADDPEATGREMRRTLGLEEGRAAGVRTWQDAVNRGFQPAFLTGLRARAWRWLRWQGERESGRGAVVLDSTSSPRAAPMSHSTQPMQSSPRPQP